MTITTDDIEYIPNWSAPNTMASIHCPVCGGATAFLADDMACSCPPGAPSALKDISPVASLPFSACGGRDQEDQDGPAFQSPSLLDRLWEYRNNARAAESEIERREWIEAGENLIDALFNPKVTCWCGVVFNALSGKCDDCLERKARIARKLAEEGEVF